MIARVLNGEQIGLDLAAPGWSSGDRLGDPHEVIGWLQSPGRRRREPRCIDGKFRPASPRVEVPPLGRSLCCLDQDRRNRRPWGRRLIPLWARDRGPCLCRDLDNILHRPDKIDEDVGVSKLFIAEPSRVRRLIKT